MFDRIPDNFFKYCKNRYNLFIGPHQNDFIKILKKNIFNDENYSFNELNESDENTYIKKTQKSIILIITLIEIMIKKSYDKNSLIFQFDEQLILSLNEFQKSIDSEFFSLLDNDGNENIKSICNKFIDDIFQFIGIFQIEKQEFNNIIWILIYFYCFKNVSKYSITFRNFFFEIYVLLFTCYNYIVFYYKNDYFSTYKNAVQTSLLFWAENDKFNNKSKNKIYKHFDKIESSHMEYLKNYKSLKSEYLSEHNLLFTSIQNYLIINTRTSNKKLNYLESVCLIKEFNFYQRKILSSLIDVWDNDYKHKPPNLTYESTSQLNCSIEFINKNFLKFDPKQENSTSEPYLLTMDMIISILESHFKQEYKRELKNSIKLYIKENFGFSKKKINEILLISVINIIPNEKMINKYNFLTLSDNYFIDLDEISTPSMLISKIKDIIEYKYMPENLKNHIIQNSIKNSNFE